LKLAIITCKRLPQGVEEDQPLFEALEQHGIELIIHAWDAAVDWSQYDACLLRSVWDYHQRTDEFNQWLSSISLLTQVINSPEVVMWNQNKKYLSELAAFGITIAPTSWLTHNKPLDLSFILKQQTSTTFFLKPVIGADSSDTLRFENNSVGIKQAQKHLDHLMPHQEMMLQPYLRSVETFGETSAIYFAGNLSHAVRKIPVQGDYRVQDTFGASDISYSLHPVEMSLSTACMQFLTNKFGEILYARFDFLHGDDGSIYLNEAELIEPSLFLHHNADAASQLVQALQKHVKSM
jgi:glutathione synthase/RimK-type ligase-like ATP-grasp enzyme